MKYNNHYNQALKPLAVQLRKQGILSEALLWRQLKGKKMKGWQFLRQRPVLDYIVDFFCPEIKLAIEIDGPSHYGNEADDELRDERLLAIGIRTLRITDRRAKKDMQSVLLEIEEQIDNLVRGSQPPALRATPFKGGIKQP